MSSDMKLELESPFAAQKVSRSEDDRLAPLCVSHVIFEWGGQQRETVPKNTENTAGTIGKNNSLQRRRNGHRGEKIHWKRLRLRSPILTSSPSFIILIFFPSIHPPRSQTGPTDMDDASAHIWAWFPRGYFNFGATAQPPAPRKKVQSEPLSMSVNKKGKLPQWGYWT